MSKAFSTPFRVVLVLPTPAMFGIAAFADELERVAAGYGIEVRTSSELTEVDPDHRQATIVDHTSNTAETIGYDMLHVVAPQSAPDWIKASPVAEPGGAAGFVDVDKHTLQHSRFPDIFALGDVAATPNSKTGAAVRKQAPVAVDNVLASLDGRALTGRYNGYGSCPLTTSRKTMLLAEFDYNVKAHPVLPDHRHHEIETRHVVPQTLRPSVPVLEPDAQGPRLSSPRNRERSIVFIPAEQHLSPPESGAAGAAPCQRAPDLPSRPCRNRISRRHRHRGAMTRFSVQLPVPLTVNWDWQLRANYRHASSDLFLSQEGKSPDALQTPRIHSSVHTGAGRDRIARVRT